MNVVIKNINKFKKKITMIRNDKIIGSINYYINNQSTFLSNLYVEKEYRKQKIGSKLIKKVEEINKDTVYLKLCAWESTNKPGLIDFYKKNGYSIEKYQKPYYYDDGETFYYLTNMYKINKNFSKK